MSAYVLAVLNVTNPEGFQEYADLALPSLAEFGVKPLAVGPATALEGTNPWQRYVLLEFPDMAAVQAWYDSPAYQAAIPLRLRNSDTGFLVAVQGLG